MYIDVSITVNPMEYSDKLRKSGVTNLTSATPGSGFLNKIELEEKQQAADAARNAISELTQNNIDTKVEFSKS